MFFVTRIYVFRFGLAHIARVGSVLATLLVTIERFVAVVYPLKRMTKSTSVSLIHCSILIAIIYNVPRFFEFHTITLEETQNSTSHAMEAATNPTHNMRLLKVWENLLACWFEKIYIKYFISVVTMNAIMTHDFYF